MHFSQCRANFSKLLTHVNRTRERLGLGEDGVAIGQVGDIVLAGLVVSLMDSQVGKRLRRVRGVHLVGSGGLVNHVEGTSQEAGIGTVGERTSLQGQLGIWLEWQLVLCVKATYLGETEEGLVRSKSFA